MLCACGCREAIGSWNDGKFTGYVPFEFHHDPGLEERRYDEAERDYDPPENSVDHLFAYLPEHHQIETNRQSRGRRKIRKIKEKQLGTVVKNTGGKKERTHISTRKMQGRGFRKDISRTFSGKIKPRKGAPP